jgi:hypothetical protein
MYHSGSSLLSHTAYPSIYGFTVLCWTLAPISFSFLTLYTVGRTPWTGDRPIARRLHKQNKRTQTSMLWERFEPTIPAFKRAKTLHALDRSATVISISYTLMKAKCWYYFKIQCGLTPEAEITYQILTLWSCVLFEKPPVAQLLKNFPTLYGTCSQEPTIGPYPEPNQSSSYHPILFLKIHFNIIRSPTCRYS